MICVPCRSQEHRRCDNLTKQGYQVPDPGTDDNVGLSANEIIALHTGNWCDCQHVTNGPTINPEWSRRNASEPAQ